MKTESEFTGFISGLQREAAARAAENASQQATIEAARLRKAAIVAEALTGVILPILATASAELVAAGIESEVGNGQSPGTENPRRSLGIDHAGQSARLMFEARLEWSEPSVTWSARTPGRTTPETGTLATITPEAVTRIIRDFLKNTITP